MGKVKIEIKWALIFTLVALLWMLLEKVSGLHGKYLDYHMYLTNLFAIPAIIIMVLALKDKKKNWYNEKMTYGEGLVTGIVLSIFIALLSPVSQWITSFVISPEYFPNVIERSVELGHYNTVAEAEAHFNFTNYAVMGAVGALVMGIATTTIAMIFIRSKK